MSDIRKTIADAVAAMHQMNKQGQLPDPQYFKCLVSLAYEYAVLDDLADAVNVVQRVPADYFSNVMPTQLSEDLKFKQVAYVLAQKLHEGGFADIGPKTNMPVAQA